MCTHRDSWIRELLLVWAYPKIVKEIQKSPREPHIIRITYNKSNGVLSVVKHFFFPSQHSTVWHSFSMFCFPLHTVPFHFGRDQFYCVSVCVCVCVCVCVYSIALIQETLFLMRLPSEKYRGVIAPIEFATGFSVQKSLKTFWRIEETKINL